MNWHSIASYAVGFLTIPVIVGTIAAYITGMTVLGEYLGDQHFIETNYWTGFWLFVGLAVIGATIIVRIFA